jgi:acyl-CoA dehydrogenase
MVSGSEIQMFLEREPKFDDIMCSLQATSKQPKGIIKETKKVIAIARKFNDEVVRPYALELDRTVQEDPEFLSWDFVKKANEWGFYTMWLPKIFGGKGYCMSSMSYFIEEIASACLGMANLIGVHYLGVATLSATWNARLTNKLCRETAEGERSGNPCLITLAITEPGAGTDVEEVDLVDQGKITCYAEKVDGGYVVNGRKVFISNGHLSTWHMLIAYSDLKKPSENTVVLAVKNGTKGFSFGRKERKMGQKGCPASELIFEDCFIPDENVCIDPDQYGALTRSAKETAMQVIDYVVSTTRAGVGAFGTGVARGAFEEALKFALETEVKGKLLINHEWVQCMLAEMYKNVAVSRLAYVETNYANGMYGFFKTLQWKPSYYYAKFLPRFIADRFVSPWMEKPRATALMRKIALDGQKNSEIHRTSGWASLAKFVGTDAGVRNCQLALELMGQAGLRHDRRAEKCLRDSKLLQIYEGTNQLNRLNLFKCLIGRSYPQVAVFQE